MSSVAGDFQILSFLDNKRFTNSTIGASISHATESQFRNSFEFCSFNYTEMLSKHPVIYVREAAIGRSTNLSRSLEKIQVLISDEDDYDDNFLRPNFSTVDRMKKLLKQMFEKFGDNLPPSSFSADGKAGLEATWQIQNRYLQLIVPDNKPAYIFHKQKSDFRLEKLNFKYDLFKWVNWLLQDNME